MQISSQFGFGLELVSDLWVPGAVAIAPQTNACSVRIAILDACAADPEVQFVCEGEAIVYRHPTGIFRCFPDRIEITPREPLDLEDLGALLIANALPAVLWQRGAFVLHAACVRLSGGLTIAIAGPSGAGKSRLAAGFVAAGAELIGDDSLALTVNEDGVLASGLPGGWFSRDKDSSSREFVPTPAGQAGAMVRLDLLAVLGEAGSAFHHLAPLAALEILMQNRHRPQVPDLLGLRGQVLSHAVKIARGLPLVSLAACGGTDSDLASLRSVLARLAREARYGSRSADAVTGV